MGGGGGGGASSGPGPEEEEGLESLILPLGSNRREAIETCLIVE